MKKLFLPVLGCLFLLTFLYASHFNEKKASAKEPKAALAKDRFVQALNELDQESGEAELLEALEDVKHLSVRQDKAEAAIAKAAVLAEKHPEGGAIRQKAEMLQGRLWIQLGFAEQGKELFEELIHAKKDQAAYREYLDSLWNIADDKEAAKVEFAHQQGGKLSNEEKAFYGLDGNLSQFLEYVRGWKVLHSTEPAHDLVFPEVAPSTTNPAADWFAEALCWGVDWELSKALACLYEGEKLASPQDQKFVPLYRASIYFINYKFPEAREAFAQYIELNKENPNEIVAQWIQLLETMMNPYYDKKFLAELSGPFLTHELYTSNALQAPQHEKGVTREQIAQLLYLHTLGLGWSQRQDEAEALSQQIVETYPDTVAASYAALGWAVLHARTNREESIEVINRLLENPDNHEIAIFAKKTLGTWQVIYKNFPAAKAYFEDLNDRVGPAPQGDVRNAHEDSNFMLDRINGKPPKRPVRPAR